MKLVGRIPVEPLDDERMTHIERRIVAGAADAAARPVRAPRRYVGFAMAAMAAMITGVIGWQLGGATEPAVVAEALPIKVNTDAQRATLDIGDAVIQSDPATVFELTRPSGGVLVTMTRGMVELEVGKRGDRAPLVVRAGETDVVVVGTHFTVDYGDGTGDVDVRVTEGVVKVVRHQQEVRVAAGQAWQSRRGLLALADVGGLRGNGGTGAGGAAGTTGTTGTTGANGANGTGSDPTGTGSDPTGTGGDPTGITVATNGAGSDSGFEFDTGEAPEVLRDRTSQVPDTRTPGDQRTGSGASSAGGGSRGGTSAPNGSGTTAARNATIDPRDPRGDIKKMIRAQPIEPALDVGESNPASAVSRYQTIIREKDGDDESRAFYSIAVLQASEKMKRTGDAERTLVGYFQRYARGKRYPEYQAALWLKLRIVCLRSIDGACRQVAAKYLREFPGTPAAAIAERITLTE